MTLKGIAVCIGLSAAAFAAGAHGTEQNDWPGPVTLTDAELLERLLVLNHERTATEQDRG